MEDLKYKYKMLGIVTLYNPNVDVLADNISKYHPFLDKLIIWDNSALDKGLKEKLHHYIGDKLQSVLWHGDGTNSCIAPAINFAWKYAKENSYDFLLIMDQDSSWSNFDRYRYDIEKYWEQGKEWAYTPYVVGCDNWIIRKRLQFRRLFINSGTVIPIKILDAVNGADETFALDALDHDLAIRIQEKGYKIACITSCLLYHTMGEPKKSEHLHLLTNNYNANRTYSITKSHIINLRKHAKWFSFSEKCRIIKEHVVMSFIRVILLEPDKYSRLRMLFKGLADGLKYTFK